MIKKYLGSQMLLFFAVLLQTTILSYLKFLQTKPDLALILLIYMSLYQGSTFGQLYGFATGLFEDVLSVSPLGLYAIIGTIVGFVLGLFKDKIDINSIVFPLFLIPVVTIVKYLAMILFSLIFTIPFDYPNIFSWKTLLEIGYNLLLGLLIFVILLVIRLRTIDKVNNNVIGL